MSGWARLLGAPARQAASGGRGERATAQLPDEPAEIRRLKDGIAAVCLGWRDKARRAGGRDIASQVLLGCARDIEQVMGWQPEGDPLTGCLPVTPEPPPRGGR